MARIFSNLGQHPWHPIHLPLWLVLLLTQIQCSGGEIVFSNPNNAQSQPRIPPVTWQTGLSEYVDTRRGTHDFTGQSSISYGNTIPATALPFGFNMYAPANAIDTGGMFYYFMRNYLEGFRISHEPSIWIGDYGMFHIWPEMDTVETDPTNRKVSFSHDHEIAKPYQYSVSLDNGIHVDLAPTDHAAVFNITYPKTTSTAYLLFDASQNATGSINVDLANGTVEIAVQTTSGCSGARTHYIYAEFEGVTLTSATQDTNRTLDTYVKFATNANAPVTLRLASSWISLEQAQLNFQEVANKSWEDIRDQAQEIWDKALGRVQLEASDAEKVIFYSNLYRSLLYPNHWGESKDGNSIYKSPYNGNMIQADMYVNNGFWDTYRSEWPLLLLLAPDTAGVMLDGFTKAFIENGWTPRWTGPKACDSMVGTSTDVVFADAYLKGIRNFDYATAYTSAVKNSTTVSNSAANGRHGQHQAIFLGYTPTESTGQSVSWHLEGCLNDAGIANMAKALGREDDATYFTNRALAYPNSFSPSVGFFRQRKANGDWYESDADFSPSAWFNGFSEGDAWQYSVNVQFDGEGLSGLYGGRDGLANHIDTLFATPPSENDRTSGIHEVSEAKLVRMGQYGHSNQPVHHIIHMYHYANTPWKAQAHTRAVINPNNGLYTDGTTDGKGWLGDEDNGEMSAWFIFSSLGFFPALGGIPEYLLTSPLYTKASIYLDNGNIFTISAPGNTNDTVYIQNANLNGVPYNLAYLKHTDIVSGGDLELTLGPTPSTWGAGTDALPTSMTPVGRTLPYYADQANGGSMSASVASVDSNSGISNVFDNNSKTVWHVQANQAAITYQFPDGAKPTILWYTLSSAQDHPEYDPTQWQLDGSNDGHVWNAIETRTQETFSWRMQTKYYMLKSKPAYNYYRLTLSGSSSQTDLQLSEIEFVGKPAL